MKIAILIVDEPIYLPVFIRKFLTERAADTIGVFKVKPLYKKESSFQAAIKYLKTFGIWATIHLTLRVIWQMVGDRLPGHLKRDHSVQSVCDDFGITCVDVKNVNSPEFIEHLRKSDLDIIVSVSVPQIFKKDLISLPKVACLNIHGSILPEYKGIMPSFWVLANDEKRTGVSIFEVNAGIDTGDIVGQAVYDIVPGISQDELIKKSKILACDLLLALIKKYETGTVSKVQFDPNQGNYYKWPTPEDVKKLKKNGYRLW